MPTFDYTALSPAGERVAGAISGASEQAVLAELESRKLIPVAIREKADAARAAGARVPARQLAAAYTQTADLLRAGVPLLRALRILSAGTSRSKLKPILAQVADSVAEGSDLADALRAHPAAFPPIHIAMVRAGEKGGFLEPILARLGRFVEAQLDLRAKVVGSLIYPAILLVAGAAVLTLIFGVFIPMFRPMLATLEESGRLGTLSTTVFLLSDLVTRYGLFTLIALAAAAAALWRLTRTAAFRARASAAITRAPVIGPLTRALATARFCRILGTMLDSAVPMLAALRIARDAAGNATLEAAIDRAADAVKQGRPLAGPLAESNLFDPDVVEMIAVGEQANNLDAVLLTVAEAIERRVDRLLGVAVKLIEPLMLVILAVVVALVALSLILPMMSLTDALSS